MHFSKFLPVRQFDLFTKLSFRSIQERIKEDTEPMGLFNMPELFHVKKYEGKITATGFNVRKKTRTGHDPNPLAEAVCSEIFDKRTMISVTVRHTGGGLIFMILWFGIIGVAAAIAWCAYLGIGIPFKPELKQPVFLTVLFTLSYGAVLLSSRMATREYKEYLKHLLIAVEE